MLDGGSLAAAGGSPFNLGLRMVRQSRSKADQLPSTHGTRRSSESLQHAVAAAEDPGIACHASRVGELGLDGWHCSMLTLEDVREVFPGASLRDRLALQRFLAEKSLEPLPQELRDDDKFLGDRTLVRQASAAAPRENLIMLEEGYLIVSGLMLTISSAALLTPQCTVSDTISCTALQRADVLAWLLTFLFQLGSVYCAWCCFTIANILSEDALRGLILSRWHYIMASNTFAVAGLLFGLPISVALRLWLLLDHTTAIVTSTLLLLGFVGGAAFWAGLSRAAFTIEAGHRISGAVADRAAEIAIGQMPQRFPHGLHYLSRKSAKRVIPAAA